MTGSYSSVVQSAAQKVLAAFDQFYRRFLEVPDQAKHAFEQQDHPQSLRLSAQRLQLYRISMYRLADDFKLTLPSISEDESNWDLVESAYRGLIKGRYAEDLALAYCHSVRRKLYLGEWHRHAPLHNCFHACRFRSDSH